MGWASGSEILDQVWHVSSHFITRDLDKITVAKKLIEIFENHDCDTVCETEVFQFLMQNDDEFLEQQMRRDSKYYDTPEELAEAYKHWIGSCEGRTIRIAKLFY